VSTTTNDVRRAVPDPTRGYAPGERRPLAAYAVLTGAFFKDKVTSFMRAPFTRFQEASGQGEAEETPRGEGMRYAIGELVACPYCVAQWVAGGLAVGHLFAPRTTRFLSAMWAAQGIADGIQLAYSTGETQT
jgi:hypothetical protein